MAEKWILPQAECLCAFRELKTAAQRRDVPRLAGCGGVLFTPSHQLSTATGDAPDKLLWALSQLPSGRLKS